MQKPDVWHVIWFSVLAAGVVLLGATLLVALAHRDSGAFANVASIWGVFVGLIGFLVTIYTLFETQRVSRKAQREVQTATVAAQQKIEEAAKQAQEAVRNIQEQARLVLERARHGIREADFKTLHMWVKEMRTAAEQGDWHRALFFAEECPAIAERLRNAEGLADTERNGLREGADNLRVLQAHIRKARLGTQTVGLAAGHARNVEALVALLERLGGRLHHEPTRGATS
jgi:hypothetical protein